MIEPKDNESDFTPLTPVMADEHSLDAPRAALAAAERTLQIVRDLAPLGDVALRDPAAALAAAEQYYAEKKAAVDGILDRMLNDPGAVQ
jgi:hypothetical protein